MVLTLSYQRRVLVGFGSRAGAQRLPRMRLCQLGSQGQSLHVVVVLESPPRVLVGFGSWAGARRGPVAAFSSGEV